MTRFHERQIVQLLLVRAAEEQASGVFTREQLAAATVAALDARDDAEIIEKRTAYLYLCLPKTLKNLGQVALLPEDLGGLCLGLAMLAGILSNYVGPSGSIHVAYNPLTFVLVWNVFVLAALEIRQIRTGRRGSPTRESVAVEPGSRPEAVEAADVPGSRSTRSQSVLVRLYLQWRAYRAKLDGVRADVEGAGRMATSFLQSYRSIAGATVALRLATLLHVGAIGILLGALAGTYLRGLFFEYNAIWRSTFLTDPGSVSVFLNFILGPASLLVNGRLLTPADIAPLLTPAGAPAAPWIHLLALTLGLLVIPTRVLLAYFSARQARAASQAIGIDLAEPYYAERIREVREGVGVRLREGIATAFHLETAKLSESVALFVCERFFDKSLAPILVGFRNRGGRISDLEEEIAAATDKLEPSLLEHISAAQRELQRALAEQVRTIIGREVQPSSEILGMSSMPALPLGPSVTDGLASNLGDAIGATATAAVAAAVATISGGVGKTLGVAVLTGLLHTSGPIGLLIGGAAAATFVGGAYFLGRDRVTASIKTWRIPASLASLALRDSKIAGARRATYTQVRREIESSLSPRIEDVTDSIISELPRAMAALQ